MLRSLLVLALALEVSAWTCATRPPLAQMARTHIAMVDQFRWSTAKAGSKADLSNAPADVEWMRAAWATAEDKMSSGECYLVTDMAPDASKEWYFCSDPSNDPKMSCEKMPEFMGKMKDGSAVYVCTTPKVA